MKRIVRSLCAVLSSACLSACGDVEAPDGTQDLALTVTDSASTLTRVDRRAIRQRVGRGQSQLDTDAAWASFAARFPKLGAWSVRDRVDRLLSAEPLTASDWTDSKERHLGKGASLAALWPKPRVVKVASCGDVEGDCDPSDPTRYEIANPSDGLRSAVAAYLWEHAH